MAQPRACGVICPSCGFTNPEGANYCAHCRMHFARRTLLLVRFRDHLYWIFRRANAGFLSGFLAWLFIPAFSRIISREYTATLHFCLQGLLGGAFLGCVDGMVEESTAKTVRGGLWGAFGGAVGGATFGHYSALLSPSQTAWGVFFFWAFCGACIGTVCAWWERRLKKLFFGALSGFVGGGIGGALGYAVYAYLIQEFDPQGWSVRRLCEGFSGGIIGITLWFSIGLAERFVIFVRHRIENQSFKECHHCAQKNPLSGWYCGRCGSVLQQSAPPASLNLSPFTTLDRLRESFRFMSRLAGTTGVIAGVAVFAVFFPINKMLAFVGLVLVAVSAYSLLVLFSSISESIQIFIKK